MYTYLMKYNSLNRICPQWDTIQNWLMLSQLTSTAINLYRNGDLTATSDFQLSILNTVIYMSLTWWLSAGSGHSGDIILIAPGLLRTDFILVALVCVQTAWIKLNIKWTV